MHKNFIAVIASSLLLASCAQPGMQSAGAPSSLPIVKRIQLSKEQIKIVKEGVTSTLKDPESARFGKMVAGRSDKKTIYVCGYVNAKNSFGGYTGDAPYNGMLVMGPRKSAFIPIGDISTHDSTVYATHKVCSDMGLDF